MVSGGVGINENLNVGGITTFRRGFRKVNASGNIQNDDYYIVCEDSSPLASYILTLPLISSVNTGQEIYIKNLSTRTILISPSLNQKIQVTNNAEYENNPPFSSGFSLETGTTNANKNWIHLISDGTSKWIMIAAGF